MSRLRLLLLLPVVVVALVGVLAVRAASTTSDGSGDDVASFVTDVDRWWHWRATPRVFSREELSEFNGKTRSELYLACMGEVFDVGSPSGRSHYAPGHSYHFFTAKDGSAAFVTGKFKGEGLTDDVSELDDRQLMDIAGWRDFYHSKYRFVGLLDGNFYDGDGEPTPELRRVLPIVMAARKLYMKDMKARPKPPPPKCERMWTRERKGEVLCGHKQTDRDGHAVTSVPRMLFTPDSDEVTCVCVTPQEASENPMLREYDGCAPDAVACQTEHVQLSRGASSSHAEEL